MSERKYTENKLEAKMFEHINSGMLVIWLLNLKYKSRSNFSNGGKKMRGIQLAKAILVYGTLICVSLTIPGISYAKLDADAALGIWFFDEGKGGYSKKILPKMATMERLLMPNGSLVSSAKP